MTLLTVKNLTKRYSLGKTPLLAVQDLSFSIEKGEILGLVGESGSGKSTLAKMLLRLTPPTSGEILFNHTDLFKTPSRKIQMIFQDPLSSLNPRMSIQRILEEPFLIHNMPPRVLELLSLVGLPPTILSRYPHEFSGGQRQRIGIARALALEPDFLVCDEPISALDVSIQAQIVTLLQALQKRLQLTYLFIAHDLSMVRYISHRIAVMYQGAFVELGEAEALYQKPLHPYTQLLIASTPKLHGRKGRVQVAVPSEIASKGCPFAPRCPFAMKKCREEKPVLRSVGDERQVSCHLY